MSESETGPALRCSTCGLDWPIIEDYRTCPCCLEKTDKVSDTNVMSEKEAFDLKVFFEFERFYEEWDASQPPERLDPKYNAP